MRKVALGLFVVTGFFFLEKNTNYYAKDKPINRYISRNLPGFVSIGFLLNVRSYCNMEKNYSRMDQVKFVEESL